MAAIPVYLLDGDPIDEKSPVYSLDTQDDGYKYIFFSLAALGWQVFLIGGWISCTPTIGTPPLRFMPSISSQSPHNTSLKQNPAHTA
jgi:hypothetical protein